MPFHVQVVAAEVIVMPRSCSCLHPVHGRRALVHLSDTVVYTRVEENALGRRRLTGVDVSHNSDVPAFYERYCACHFESFCKPSSRYSKI